MSAPPPDPLQEAHLFLGNLLDHVSLLESMREEAAEASKAAEGAASAAADVEAGEGDGGAEGGDGDSAGAGAAKPMTAAMREAAKQEAAEKQRFYKLGGSYKAHLFAFAYVDNVGDSMFDSVKDILEKLTRKPTPFLKLYFEVFAEIIHHVAAPTEEERTAPPTAASLRKQLERVAVAKRMWEFREAIKAEILDVRADAEEEVAEQAEDEADMLETRTATLKVATEQFRELKNTTRDFLRTSVTVLDKQTAETKEATKEMDSTMDTRMNEHNKQIKMMEYGTDSVDILVEAQQTMLSYRVCGMCLVDRRMLRRQCYICFGFVMIVMTVYGAMQL